MLLTFPVPPNVTPIVIVCAVFVGNVIIPPSLSSETVVLAAVLLVWAVTKPHLGKTVSWNAGLVTSNWNLTRSTGLRT